MWLSANVLGSTPSLKKKKRNLTLGGPVDRGAKAREGTGSSLGAGPMVRARENGMKEQEKARLCRTESVRTSASSA